MAENKRGRFGRLWHDTFHDWFFRSLIGPAQTSNAVHGADRFAREQWKRDLAERKRFTREQRERARQRPRTN
ncbi:hypothetical protein ACFQFC_10930 [Amorphoplanes digitatis]|uniref:Uncharacterized protein n=1 Tax=Actinoplanes digitatis TaxID=1868 RepID=A0A7W7I1H8_9ACTN|nr:hypothetical protein [Actinoplanes digitatis]MBB4764712.1 hypothetical protein [Actinoplanes digitatis]BFE74261.1 hypothetical protein GCM10020092_075620 [Actinoplanes digitatis]GID91336.1 hypothetical protein Adi01nite_07480 [Actinoplanes digitatis]